MSYNISSDRLSNPLLKELLNALSVFFGSIGSEFYVIGATARDIIMSGIHAQHTGRKTVDLDIAIAISDWNRYQEISDRLCHEVGFTKSKDQKQRFLYKEVYMLDIVPFGDVVKKINIFTGRLKNPLPCRSMALSKLQKMLSKLRWITH